MVCPGKGQVTIPWWSGRSREKQLTSRGSSSKWRVSSHRTAGCGHNMPVTPSASNNRILYGPIAIEVEVAMCGEPTFWPIDASCRFMPNLRTYTIEASHKQRQLASGVLASICSRHLPFWPDAPPQEVHPWAIAHTSKALRFFQHHCRRLISWFDHSCVCTPSLGYGLTCEIKSNRPLIFSEYHASSASAAMLYAVDYNQEYMTSRTTEIDRAHSDK